MKIFPAIDLRNGKAVRLYQGDYNQMTVYHDNPLSVAEGFEKSGARYLHMVDLDGAKAGCAVNLPIIQSVLQNTGLQVEIGGGIRTPETVETYVKAGVLRVILGTAALKDQAFLQSMLHQYGEKIAVGVDIKNGMVATDGWTKTSDVSCDEFCRELERMGAKTVICTDISRDGAMKGTNRELYAHLRQHFSMEIIASGGVSTLEDVRALRQSGVHGAILGKALYTGELDLAQAIAEAGGVQA